MKTVFPYSERIDYTAYLKDYLRREDAIKALPNEESLRQAARKAIVKDHLVLAPIGPDECARIGDTVTLSTVSELPKFNKPKVTVSIGRGLYNKDLEEAVVGRKAGDSVHVIINDKPVDATVLEIRRKTVPEPTDEMAAAMEQKDFKGNLLATVADYEKFYAEQQTLQTIATVNYFVMEKILADHPMTEFDEEDVRVLGELERKALRDVVLEQDGVDLETLSKEEMQERWNCDSFADFIALRHDWYQMKIQQCYTYSNILGIPCEGKNDPLDHYEVLSELTDKMYTMVKELLTKEVG